MKKKKKKAIQEAEKK
jgi:hypothetical protein